MREQAQMYDQMMPLVEKAVAETGLIKPEHIPFLAEVLAASEDGRPEGAEIFHRKNGTQLSKAEKKAAGLRANAYFTRELLEMLTDKGRLDPLSALATTLNHARAPLDAARAIAHAQREIANARAADCTHYRWRSANDGDTCAICRKRDGKRFAYPAGDDLSRFPGTCTDCADDGGCRCYAEPILPDD